MSKIKHNNTRYQPGYHIFPNGGWMNDPNGLVYFKGYYHVFFQYYPKDSEWGPMHWGHVRSKDLIHWQRLPIALEPENENGCFSGSAVVYKGRLYLIYTANIVLNEGEDAVVQNQCLAFSDDGIHFEKYAGNPIIARPPEDNTENFRDPKVWNGGDRFYLIAGGQTKMKHGRVLLYTSMDLKTWQYEGEAAQSEQGDLEGTMWECPDLFRLNGKDVLIISPQGIKTRDGKYKNLYQTGYFIGNLKAGRLKYEPETFKELDLGHDFYAAQTFLAPDGRRILIAWMDMWEKKFPEQADGWAGMMTFPREVVEKDNQLFMKPVRELDLLRQGVLFNEKTVSFEKTTASRRLEWQIESEHHDDFDLTISYGEQQLSLNYHDDVLSLTKTGDDSRSVELKTTKVKLQILMDTSSVELFVIGGPTFSERLYGSKPTKLTFEATYSAKLKLYKLDV